MKKVKIICLVIFLLWLVFLVLPRFGYVKHIDYCNGMLGMDYGAAVDGPYTYVQLPTFTTISQCGGYCMTQECRNCPPKNWNCK